MNHTPIKSMISGADVVRQMGCTQTEFERWLPGATHDAQIESRQQGDQVEHRISIAGGALIITATQLAPRRIGLLRLPVLQVRFHFDHMDDAQRAEFLHYFDLYTRRGGG